MEKDYTVGLNEKSEALGLVFLALWCFAFGYSIGRLGVYYGWWTWVISLYVALFR